MSRYHFTPRGEEKCGLGFHVILGCKKKKNFSSNFHAKSLSCANSILAPKREPHFHTTTPTNFGLRQSMPPGQQPREGEEGRLLPKAVSREIGGERERGWMGHQGLWKEERASLQRRKETLFLHGFSLSLFNFLQTPTPASQTWRRM